MRKLALFIIAGLFFGSVTVANAVHPLPGYMEDLGRWMGRDHTYYENRWDPAAERFARFEDRTRHRIERLYRNGEISHFEYRHLREGLASFDDHLRRALYDSRLSWREQRFLESRQEHIRGDIRAAVASREYHHRDYDERYAPYGSDEREHGLAPGFREEREHDRERERHDFDRDWRNQY